MLEDLKRWMWDVCTCQAFRPSDQAEEGERAPLLPGPDTGPIRDQPAGLTMPRHPLLPEPGLSTGGPSILGPDGMPGPKAAVGDDEAMPEPEAGPSRLTRRSSVIPERPSSLNEEAWSKRGRPGPPQERREKPAPVIPEGQKLLRGMWRRNLANRALPPQPPADEAGTPPADPEAERQAQLHARLAAEQRRAERHAQRRRERERQGLAMQDARLIAREADLAAWEESLAEEVAALSARSDWQPELPSPPGMRGRRAEDWIAGLQELEESGDLKEWKTNLEAWRQTLKTWEAEFAARLKDYERRQQNVAAAQSNLLAQEQDVFAGEPGAGADEILLGFSLYAGPRRFDDDDLPGSRARRRAVTPEPEVEEPAAPIVRGRGSRRLDADVEEGPSGSGRHSDPEETGDDDRRGRRASRRAASPDPAAEAQPAEPIVRGRRPRPDR